MNIEDFIRWRYLVAKKTYSLFVEKGFSKSSASLLCLYYVFMNSFIDPKATKILWTTDFFPNFSRISMTMYNKVGIYNKIKREWGETKIPGPWIDRYKAQGRWY